MVFPKSIELLKCFDLSLGLRGCAAQPGRAIPLNLLSRPDRTGRWRGSNRVRGGVGFAKAMTPDPKQHLLRRIKQAILVLNMDRLRSPDHQPVYKMGGI